MIKAYVATLYFGCSMRRAFFSGEDDEHTRELWDSVLAEVVASNSDFTNAEDFFAKAINKICCADFIPIKG